MKWTISKCGVVGPQTGFKLDSKPLPSCKTYKYLGIPHSAGRVLWDQYLSIVLEKHNNMLTALSDHAKLWSPVIRLSIWRTFTRPLIEYCLPITLHWLRQNPHSNGLKNLTNAFKKAMCFIVQHGKFRQITEFLTGIGPLTTRLESLQCGFAFHLQNLSPSNPLRQLQDYVPRSTHDVIQLCFDHPWLKEAEDLDFGDIIVDPKTKLGILLMNKRKMALETGYVGNLKSYIKKQEGSLTDQSLKTKSDHAMKWRMNLLFTNRKCSCGLRFHRGHIRDCGLIDDHPLVIATKATPKYITQSNELTDAATDSNRFNFNCLDFLLNESKLDEFELLVTHLKAKLNLE